MGVVKLSQLCRARNLAPYTQKATTHGKAIDKPQLQASVLAN